jgi:hypothetical protein
MISHFDSLGGSLPDGRIAQLRKRIEPARQQLEAIAALPEGPEVFRAMRASGEIPPAVAALMRHLTRETFAKLTGGHDA